MQIILITGILGVLAVLGLAWRLPPVMRARGIQARLVMLIWGPPPPRHVRQAQDTRAADRAAQRAWEYQRMAPRKAVAGRPPWALIELHHPASWGAESGPGAGLPPLPPMAPPEDPWRVPRTDGGQEPPGDWREQTRAALGPPGDDPEPPPPGGVIYRRDGLDIADPDPPGTVVIGPGADMPPTIDDAQTWAAKGTPPGAMHWRPCAALDGPYLDRAARTVRRQLAHGPLLARLILEGAP